MASVTSFDVEENDLIVIATDGVWDNLPDSTILEETKNLTVKFVRSSRTNVHRRLFSLSLQEPTSENLQRIAHALAKRALDNGNNPKFNSPFAKSAKRALGIDIIGKATKNEEKPLSNICFFRWQTGRHHRSVGSCHFDLLMSRRATMSHTWC